MEAVRGAGRQAARHAHEIEAALRRAAELGPIDRLPAPAPRDGTGDLGEAELELHDRLKDWRRRRAEREGLDSSLVLNRHVLLRLAREKPRTVEGLARVEGLLDWQIAAFGAELVQCIEEALREFQSAPPRPRRRKKFRG